MDLNEYQRLANRTDQWPATKTLDSDQRNLMIPLLGLASEVGELLGEHKKWLRDGESYKLFPDRVKEELGRPLVVRIECGDQARLHSRGCCRIQSSQDQKSLAADTIARDSMEAP